MIRPVSRKRAALLRIYAKRRTEYLEANPQCIRCGGRADQIHHRRGRIGALLLDESNFASVCGPCHEHITRSPLEAIRNGWSLPRVGVEAEEEAATDQGSEPEWLPTGESA